MSELDSIDEIENSGDKKNNHDEFDHQRAESINKKGHKENKKSKSFEMNMEEDDQVPFADLNSSMMIDSDQ